MEPPRTLWLSTSGGGRIALRAAGVLIGRGPHCDLVLVETTASRVQAVVYAGSDGPCLTVLGKGRTAVNGEPVLQDRDLAVGDRIELPGMTVVIEADAATAPPDPTWVVRGPGGMFGVVRSPFVVGAGVGCDLRVESGPDRLLRFHLFDQLEVEAIAPIHVGDRPLAPGDTVELMPGMTIATDAGEFEVIAGRVIDQAPTAQAELGVHRTRRVRLEFLPRGGRLTVAWRGQDRTAYLAERRCDLIATLLKPPAPFVAGAFIPDDVLLPKIWPGKSMSRMDLNTLLHRARQDLTRAELDGAALLDRADGGSATRFVLADGAAVEIA